MAQLRCNSCGGVYEDRSASGAPYYHACPPLPRVLIRTLLGAVEPFETVVSVTLVDDGRGGIVAQRTFNPPLPLGAVDLGDTFIERPNKRDENVGALDDRGRGLPKSPGDGAVVLKP